MHTSVIVALFCGCKQYGNKAQTQNTPLAGADHRL